MVEGKGGRNETRSYSAGKVPAASSKLELFSNGNNTRLSARRLLLLLSGSVRLAA
jgi:hypothetical protein